MPITNTDPPLAPAVSGPSSGSSNLEASVSDLSLEQLQALIWAEVQSAHGSPLGPVSAAASVPPLVPDILHIYVTCHTKTRPSAQKLKWSYDIE